MTKSHWGITTRRIAECFMIGIPVIAVLFIPIATSFYHDLYEWVDVGHHGEEHADGHGESPEPAAAAPGSAGHGHGSAAAAGSGDADHEGGHAHTPYEEQLHHSVLEHKAGWLNVPFWMLRAFIYFAIWFLIAIAYFRWSTSQDEATDEADIVRATNKMQNWSSAALAGFGLTLTFAAFDWVMSMEAAWYSTIYGVCMFAGCVVVIFASVILVALRLVATGDLGNAVRTDHFHDLGKLMFGFMCFWTYVNFSQFMLIWYAGIPEEATYYQLRGDESGWGGLGVAIVICFFVLPFLGLISRIPKRNPATLGLGCIWLITMHIVNMYWCIVPNAHQHLGQGILSDLAALLGCGGLYCAFVFWKLERHPLIPVGDPRLDRCLHHVQTQ